MRHALFIENENAWKYFDKYGKEIKSGMVLRHDEGDTETVYVCGDETGSKGLGFMAIKPRFLVRSSNMVVEYYPLHQFNLKEWEIVGEE